MIRVIVADDHHLVRQGIRALLERADDIEVVGEAADGQEAVELVQRLAPDVLVIDIAMPRLDGTQATERVRALGVATQVVILSMHSDETLVRQTLRSGARGYLLKRSVTEELMLAVRAAVRGEIYLSPALSVSFLDEFLAVQADSEERRPSDLLTPREREVLQLIAEGHTNTAIAQMMNVTVKTVEKHRANLMSKLNVHDVAGLVRMAIKHGLVFLDE
ncbi:MAG: response regulator transcription factor [Anaerolineae bacterium]